MIRTIRAPEPNRSKGLNRAERALKFISHSLADLQARNNSTNEGNGIVIFTVVDITRLLNIKFTDLQIEGVKDADRRAKTYYIVLSGLFLHSKPVTKTYLINYLGFSYSAAMPVINNLIKSGYIQEAETSRTVNFKGKAIQAHESGIKLTAKGLDKLAFITDLLTDKRLF